MAQLPVNGFKSHPLRAELLALYDEVDALLAPYRCESSHDCCDFGKTGREPYPTPIELEELQRAMRSANVCAVPKKKRLTVVGATARVCPMLSPEGRCRVYAARPFGCRTFFCERVVLAGIPGEDTGGRSDVRLPRKEVQHLARRVAELAARFSPADPRPRPLTRAIK